MPRGDQIIRQWQLLITLTRHPSGLSIHQLGKILKAERRTLYRDLSILKSAGFPIKSTREAKQTLWTFDARLEDFLGKQE